MIVGLVGNIGVGKTTAQKHIELRGFKAYNMAGPLKKMARCLGFTETECYGTQEQKLTPNAFWGVSGREFLQKFGTEVCREFLPSVVPQMNSVWVQCFEKYAQENKDQLIVVGDVRFLNEAESVKKMGGKLIRINRETSHTGLQTKHDSELEQNQIVVDYTIDNNYSVEVLKQHLDHVIGFRDRGNFFVVAALFAIIVILVKAIIEVAADVNIMRLFQ